MRVEPLQPDEPPVAREPASPPAFARALDAIGSVLERAQTGEDAFAAGTASLQDAVYERARADVVLAVATATAQRCAQAVQSVLNMQL